MNSFFKFSALLIWFFTTTALASDTQIRGFGTLGVFKHDADNLGYHRDMGLDSTDANSWSFSTDSILGVQVNHTLSDQWSLAGQLVYKNRLDYTFNNSVEWAFAKYTSDTLPLTVRIGRTGADVFMLSEYRNVGFAYLWARPPVEFYGPLAFDYIDGFDLSYNTFLNETFFQARFAFGSVENNFLEKELVIEASPAATTSFLWEVDNWKFHLGYAYIEVDSSPTFFNPLIEQLEQAEFFWPGAAEVKDQIDINGAKFDYYSAGFAYDSADWVAQAELSRIETEGSIFTSSHNAYISLGRRFDDWTVYSIAAISENTDEVYQAPAAPPPLEDLRNFAQRTFSSIAIDQRSFGIGARWDITNNTALKMQWDHIWIKPYGAGLWRENTPSAAKEEVDVISINLNFLF